jgi:hypothetical protein
MKISYFFLIFITFNSFPLFAQKFGNEWVDYSKKYYKTSVNKEGIYRITYNQLQSVGFPVATTDPHQIQMFFQGKEIAIRVVGEEDSVFNQNDYIEFYGRSNRFDQLSEMFEKPENMPRIFNEAFPFFTYYTDYSMYFITDGKVREKGKRINTHKESNPSIAPDIFHTQFLGAEGLLGVGNYSLGPLFPVNFNGFDERGALFSHFTETHGNVSRQYAPGNKINLALSLVDAKVKEARVVNVQPRLTVKVVGRTNTLHNVEIFADILPDSQKRAIENISFNNRVLVTTNTALSTANFPQGNGAFYVSFKVNKVSQSSQELLSFGTIQLAYPQGFDMQGAGARKFLLAANPVGKSKIQLTNVAPNTKIFDITDEHNVIQIATEASNSGTTLTAIVPNTNRPRTLIASTSPLSSPKPVSSVNFAVINPAGRYDYLIITDERLKQPVNGIDAVQAYADYRSSIKGGNFRPLIITFQQISDLFGYGEILPLSMRRFTNYMTRFHQSKYLFIVGKGLQQSLNYFYSYYASDAVIASLPFHNMIPPWGNPSSDHEITAGQNGFPLHVPSLATGRIAANKPIDVLNYLNKVKEYELDELDAPWKKEVLHLSGGFQLNENITYRAYVDAFARIAQGDFFGANVETLSKKTTDYVEFIDITQQINAGKGLVTFFGHSSIDNIDIDVGRVSEPRLGFRNKGKYPFMIVNGCGSGNAFANSVSLGEDWIITPDKGAIGFLAHSALGLDGPLRIYTQTLYETWFSRKGMINKPIGIVMQEFLKTYLSRFTDELAIANAQQILLQGDPALVLFKSTLPDYSITENDQQLFIRPLGNRSLTAQSDSFRIGIPVKNLGITDEKRFQVAVRRTYPDGIVENLRTTRHSRKVSYLDTVYYTVANPKDSRDRINGNNTFEVIIDPSNEISETRKDNNINTISFFFRKGSMINIAPKEFSIVSKQPVTFIAQNTDAFTRERLYRFQLDTAHTFNSPALRDTVVYGYITPFWTTNLLADNQVHDSTVYYWRTRYAQLTPDDDPSWADASFVYIKNSPDGWSQSKIPQFPKNTLERVEPNLQTRKWNFADNVVNIQARTTGSSNPNWATWELMINGQAVATSANCAVQQNPRGCGSTIDRMIMVSIDGETGRVYREFFFDQADPCGANLLVTSLEQCFFIRTSNLMDNYLKKVKNGDYVILMNSRFFGNFGGGNIASLSQIGVRTSNLDNRGISGTPFIIIGQKGAPIGSALERYGADALQEINVSTVLRRPSRSGQITSTLIGPAAEWGNTFRLINNAENPTRESWKLDVIGVDFNGREQVVRENIRQDGLNLKDLNPATFPYIKLRLNVLDSVNRTPYQLQRWQVIYKEVPEGILLYDTLSYRENTLLEIVEGDSIKIGFNFLNISGNDFKEPLTVQYEILNIPTGRRTRLTQNITAPKRNQTTYFKTNLYSLNFLGENRMTVFVNPRLQAEQIYENNQLEVRFKVKDDDINPVLDVAVDGRHIMDGEIVSPMPMISIGLTDENKYLVHRDTSGMEIFLTRNCPTCKPQRIYMNNPNLIWTVIPEKNKLQIEYRSERLENGTYKLSVQGSDLRNNRAGAQPFSVTFKVINETKISNFYPYPNPFTTNMKFVFTLTGEVPDDIRIQIMTITGKVVRTIHKDELGALRVGDNLSEFSWDGTDQFGDQLARGVYLFKVDVRKQGKDFERFETAGDGLFEKGFGKIYLMR